MMKYLIVFLILVFGSCIYLLFSQKEYPVSLPEKTFSDKEFVSMKDGKFQLKNQDFFPLVLNYIVSLQTNGEDIWPRPSFSYYDELTSEQLSRDSAIYDLKADLILIKEMGFNTVRIVGVGEVGFNDSIKYSPISMRLEKDKETQINFFISRDESFIKYFGALEEIFKITNEIGLKVIFLVKARPEVYSSKYFIERLCYHFQNDATILAYDLFNEPLYFDRPERSKKDVYNISKEWYKSIKKNAPNQLITIGLVGIREVMEWDPNILSVDFISFHPYEYEPEQVRNEIYWYGKYVKKPWIIGETAIPADNDSIPYSYQNDFASSTLKQTFNCGGIGYSWWQYRDVNWHIFHQDYMGVMTRNGSTRTKSGMVVKGTVKPIAEIFNSNVTNFFGDNCNRYGNYYNYSNGKAFRLIGKLHDINTKEPIAGGLILAWNEWWSSSHHTVTQKDGSFELLSTFPLYHWMASATEYSMVRDDFSPDSSKFVKGIPTMDIGLHEIYKLNYLQVNHD